MLQSDNSIVKMQLTPKSVDSSIRTITITFGAASKMPQHMTITLDDGTVLNVSIGDIKTNADIPSARFSVSAKDYPGYEIIDLR